LSTTTSTTDTYYTQTNLNMNSKSIDMSWMNGAHGPFSAPTSGRPYTFRLTATLNDSPVTAAHSGTNSKDWTVTGLDPCLTSSSVKTSIVNDAAVVWADMETSVLRDTWGETQTFSNQKFKD